MTDEIERLRAELSPDRLAQLDRDLWLLERTIAVVPPSERLATASRIRRNRRFLDELKVLANVLQWEVIA